MTDGRVRIAVSHLFDSVTEWYTAQYSCQSHVDNSYKTYTYTLF